MPHAPLFSFSHTDLFCVLVLIVRCIGFTRSHTAFHRRTHCATSVFFLFKGILSRKSSSLPFWCLPLLQAIDSRFITEEHRSMAAENRAPKNQKRLPEGSLHQLAEGEGFEPSLPRLEAKRISRPPHSAALPPFQVPLFATKCVAEFVKRKRSRERFW